MKKQKELLIIMPAYNAEATIKSSVYSVIGQTFSKFKLYIIKDYQHERVLRLNKMAIEQMSLLLRDISIEPIKGLNK